MTRNQSGLPRERRAGAIVIHDGQLLVNWRHKDNRTYYVLPGGETEPGETPEQAVVRELDEETSIAATVDRLVYEVVYTNIGFTHWYFLCSYGSGEPALRPDAEEQEDNARGDNLYRPMWVPVDQLPTTELYPIAVRDRLVVDIPASFPNPMQQIPLRWADRRQ